MNKVVLRLKSGREFMFECESYKIERFKYDGSLSNFTYKGGIGECPIWFDPDDVEAIAVVCKGREDEK